MPGSFTFHTQVPKPQLGLSGPSTFEKKVHPRILWVEALRSGQMRLSIRVRKTPGRTIAFHHFW